MTAPLDLRPGDRVRVLGLYRRRRVTFVLRDVPLLLEDRGVVMLDGYSATSGPGGNASRWIVRFVRFNEPVEVLP